MGDGIVELEFPRCPLCQGEQFDVVIDRASDRLKRKPGVFQVQQCKACELVITRPRPTASALGFFYENAYSGSGSAGARAVQAGVVGDWVARYRLGAVKRFEAVGKGHRVLDVGCGYGAFTSRLKRATGCEVVGIDMDAGCIAQAQDAKEVRYLCGTLADADLTAGQFDVVTFFESLEHHADPVEALRKAWDLIKPGGLCVVEVPNFNGTWRRVFGGWWLPLLVPQHLVHFTPETLRHVLQAAGFEVKQRHVAMFYPAESTASLARWLNELLGRPIRKYKLRWTRPDGALVLALLALWWVFVEVPSQALLVLAGRSGHQLVGARKPYASRAPSSPAS